MGNHSEIVEIIINCLLRNHMNLHVGTVEDLQAIGIRQKSGQINSYYFIINFYSLFLM